MRPASDDKKTEPASEKIDVGEKKSSDENAISRPTIPPRPVPPVPTGASQSQTFTPGSDIHLVSEFVLTGCEVACRRCLGRWYVERVFSDGDVVLSCYSCRAAVTGDLYPHLADERREEKRRRRKAEDEENERASKKGQKK
jgi:hypothetical protein